jgi:hypothetical protein
MPNGGQTPEPRKASLEAAGTTLKYTLGVGVGALVFSTGLVTKEVGYFCPTPQKGKIGGTSDRLVALRDRVSGAEIERR